MAVTHRTMPPNFWNWLQGGYCAASRAIYNSPCSVWVIGIIRTFAARRKSSMRAWRALGAPGSSLAANATRITKRPPRNGSTVCGRIFAASPNGASDRSPGVCRHSNGHGSEPSMPAERGWPSRSAFDARQRPEYAAPSTIVAAAAEASRAPLVKVNGIHTTPYSKSNPFPARLLKNVLLNKPDEQGSPPLRNRSGRQRLDLRSG